MVRQALKWGGMLAAFVPLAVSAIEFHKERALVESRSVQMEDEITAVVDGLNARIESLERRVEAAEGNGPRPAKKARRAKKPRSYKRAWLQQVEAP
tara:strand:+ start:1162 stop:1449 length:288 start_codon:yes stop_codon:yes gene_type:complete